MQSILVVVNKHNTARVTSCWFIIYYCLLKVVDYLVLNLALLITNSTFPRNHRFAVSATFYFPEASGIRYRPISMPSVCKTEKDLIAVLPVRRIRCVNNALSRVRPTFFDIANSTAVIRFSLLVSITLLFYSQVCNYRFSMFLDLSLQIPTYSLSVCSRIRCSFSQNLNFQKFSQWDVDCSFRRTVHVGI